MRNLTWCWLLASLMFGGVSVAQAEGGWGWPSLFSKDEPSRSRNPADSWWSGSQPSFGKTSSRTSAAPAAPTSRWVWKPTPPAPIKKINQGTKKVYHYTIGWMMPRKTSTPTSLTGSNTGWNSKPKAKPASSSSGWGWFGSSEPEPPATVRDFLLMERSDP